MAQRFGLADWLQQKNRGTWIALGCMLIAAAWLARPWLVETRCMPALIDPRGGEIVQYSRFLAEHNPFLTCINLSLAVSGVIGAALLVLLAASRGMPRRMLILMLLSGVFLCGSLLLAFMAGFAVQGLTLTHATTTRFGGRVLHLASGIEITGGDNTVFDAVYLFECDTSGETCQARQVERTSPGKAGALSFSVDEAGQMLIVHDGWRAIYTTGSRSSRLPDAFRSREALNPDNAGKIAALINLQDDIDGPLSWSADGRLLAAAGNPGVWLYRFDGDRLETEVLPTMPDRTVSVDGPASPVEQMALGAEGRLLLAMTIDTHLYQWDLSQDGQPRQALDVDVAFAEDIALSPDGALLAAGTSNGTILYRGPDWVRVASLGDTPLDVRYVTFSPDGRYLAETGSDRAAKGMPTMIRSWRMDDLVSVLSMSGENIYTESRPVFGPDGDQLYYLTWRTTGDACACQHELRIHAASGGQASGPDLAGFADNRDSPTPWLEANPMAASPDGGLLAIASRDVIRVWDTQSWQQVAELRGHTGIIMSLAFSPDGTLLASSAQDGTLRVWGVESSKFPRIR